MESPFQSGSSSSSSDDTCIQESEVCQTISFGDCALQCCEEFSGGDCESARDAFPFLADNRCKKLCATDINLGCLLEGVNLGYNSPIAVGQTVCGTSSSIPSGLEGDQDNFLLEIPDDSSSSTDEDGMVTVSFELTTTFPVFQFNFRDLTGFDITTCDGTDDAPADINFQTDFRLFDPSFDPSTLEGPFEVKRSYKLPPGQYEVKVLLFGGGFECDSGNKAEYTLSVSEGPIDGVEVFEGIGFRLDAFDPEGNCALRRRTNCC